jgi:hypothetical protein
VRNNLLLSLSRDLGPERSIVLLTRPVVLGLGHSMSLGWGLVPVIIDISSSVQVELGVVKEFSCLGNIFGIVGLLLGYLSGTDLFVFVLAESTWNVRVVSKLSSSKLYC